MQMQTQLNAQLEKQNQILELQTKQITCYPQHPPHTTSNTPGENKRRNQASSPSNTATDLFSDVLQTLDSKITTTS